MIILKFKVEEQTLKRIDIKNIVAQSRNELYASFELDAVWQEKEPITAQFTNSEITIDVFVEDGKCLIPWEVIQDRGILSVCLIGGDLLTTNTVDISILGTGVIGGLVPTKASPGVYSHLVDEINQLKELELIAEYEVTEETSGGSAINISLDNNGNAFELKEAILVVNTVVTSTGTMYADGRINNVYISNLINGLANKAITVVSAKMNKIGDKYLCDYEVCKLNRDRYSTSGARQIGKMFFADGIKSIGVTVNGVFNAGTVVELYGRRY